MLSCSIFINEGKNIKQKNLHHNKPETKINQNKENSEIVAVNCADRWCINLPSGSRCGGISFRKGCK
jgi:hypothetical protein